MPMTADKAINLAEAGKSKELAVTEELKVVEKRILQVQFSNFYFTVFTKR